MENFIEIYMVHICSHEIVEKILKIIKRNNVHDCNNKTEYTTNNYIDNKTKCDQMGIKERIAKLIKENEKYFIYEITGTTADAILHDSHSDMERLKMLGYSHGIAVDVFEKYGIFLYVTDLSRSTNAPNAVKHELQLLINKYGIEKVAEEIAIYLKENYPGQFGINIVCTP